MSRQHGWEESESARARAVVKVVLLSDPVDIDMREGGKCLFSRVLGPYQCWTVVDGVQIMLHPGNQFSHFELCPGYHCASLCCQYL